MSSTNDEIRARHQQVREDNIAAALRSQRLVRVKGYQEGAARWCTGSLSFPDADPPHDSWGDCTECGETLIWVVADGD